MITFSQLITVFIVSIDGFCCGMALAAKKVKLNIFHILCMGIIPIIFTYYAMNIGSALYGKIPKSVSDIFGATLFFTLAFLVSRKGIVLEKESISKQSIITFTATLFTGVAVASDASVAAFSMALGGVVSPWLPLLFGAMHFVLIGIGYLIPRQKSIHNTISMIPNFSAVCFTILGIMRLI